MKTTLTTSQVTARDNPMGLDGFEFVEFASQEPEKLAALFERLHFTPIAKHRSKNVLLYRQGQVNFILNQESQSYAMAFAKEHGPCACAMAFRVKDAKKAFERAVALGAKPFLDSKNGKDELAIPAIYGIGGSLLYFVDRYASDTIYDHDFIPLPQQNQHPQGEGLMVIDHLTHNVYQGEMDKWANFYQDIFNFYEIRYFDIEGKKTGLTSRALSSPCGKIKIPLNQSKDNKSQIEEYLREYKGEGIQHIAMTTKDIYSTIEGLKHRKVNFLDVPDTYYEMIKERVQGHHEDIARMQKNKILIDGEVNDGAEQLLLQIFTENVIGPIFFEIIQRKGNDGFGEGNFTALFEAIERDQMRRGVL
ncbi:4-hydroxyphenylpyruvate dioxygenase [Candidatus Berkiella aquae]|uniref:4-hydroxyphenylpyruvate dioxygenase n=1 Tax=Candidatus Berkiella aquae TaxID=295108 RepID=A0A0Q9Z1N1_9GAMM|nr:4-hydroxyphenylpyruvate dioxygenase [Candidatus Berkiella aquae]MCS5712412.1 4-hydroxyphenylpyruvate dioxygenase [Candidatus Berkiella aquae]